MTPRAMDSLDHVEAVMVIEQMFGIAIPDSVAESFGSPREIVNWLELHLSNHGTWRREQIAAIVRELFRQQDQ